jgi:hypothetical protein
MHTYFIVEKEAVLENVSHKESTYIRSTAYTMIWYIIKQKG